MPSLKILNERLAALEAAVQKRPPPWLDMRALTLPERDFLDACSHDNELLSLSPNGKFKFRHNKIFEEYMRLTFQCMYFPRNTPQEIIKAHSNQSYLRDTLTQYFLKISANDKSLPRGDFSFYNLRAHIYLHLRSLCKKYGFNIDTGNTINITPTAEWSDEDYCTLCGILMLSLPHYSRSMDENCDFVKMMIATEKALDKIYLMS